MTNTTYDNLDIRQAEIAAAGRLTVAEMRAMIEAGREEQDDAENMIDRIEAVPGGRSFANDLRSRVERQRLELDLFEEMASAFEQGRLNKAARASFSALLGLRTTH
ncbi:hypothetical protein FG93_03511 [Bosea sp. LC85]|uniref:hypothetical protein n=1 Tax=Bosea sp. LC85 TaxID=1502851 RepID=UPI0004E2DFA6|nr:hypothetical protein [Bosea sp. LC85]KFC68889.1 hypothetical protein FG93_03511 [Bosea sp. LC85]